MLEMINQDEDMKISFDEDMTILGLSLNNIPSI
jgi:hypothetical protein